MLQAALQPVLMFMELDTAKYVGVSLDTSLIVSPDAFGAYSLNDRDSNIDGNYVDGISLTHGRNPREHIWTFAGALSETVSVAKLNCPCTNSFQAEFATPPRDPVLLGMTTSATLAVQIDGNTDFIQTIPYGMELVADQTIPAAL